jgi:hypothetical protein
MHLPFTLNQFFKYLRHPIYYFCIYLCILVDNLFYKYYINYCKNFFKKKNLLNFFTPPPPPMQI